MTETATVEKYGTCPSCGGDHYGPCPEPETGTDDLIGYEYVGSNGFLYRVTGEATSPAYMRVDVFQDGTKIDSTVRVTGQLRRHRELQDPAFGAPLPQGKPAPDYDPRVDHPERYTDGPI